jgi:transposase
VTGDARWLPALAQRRDALDGWGRSGTTEAMHDQLRRACRIAAGRTAEPTAAVIDSQSVKAAETVAAASSRRALARAGWEGLLGDRLSAAQRG